MSFKCERVPLLKPAVFGVDVYPQYSRSESLFVNPTYALTILEDEAVAKQFNRIPKLRLIQLINSYRPALLATDNVYELAPSLESLRHLFTALPPETRIIQVTGAPKEAINLQEAASRHGLNVPSKTSPVEESEACAMLAALGAGAEVQALEDETKIIVCRDTSLGPGGSSQARYRRGIHVSILAMAKKIEETLQRAHIDYDLLDEKSDFGLERAYFTVYAPRTRLTRLVRLGHGNYLRVKMAPVYRRKIEFLPRGQPEPLMVSDRLTRKLILGFDPGTTCGLAVLAFDSSPLYVDSHRGLSRGDIVRIVLELGEVVIVAADVMPAPDFVVKLAKMLDAVVFTPESLLEASEKQDIAQKYLERYRVEVKDPHARDALVAALKAFQHYRNKFEQVEIEAQKTGQNIPVDEAKALVVRGHSVQKAIASLTSKLSERKETVASAEVRGGTPTEEDLRIRSLQESVSFYKDQVRSLKDVVEKLNHTVKSLESKVHNLQTSLEYSSSEQVKRIRAEREYQLLQRETDSLRAQLGKAREEAEQYQKRFEAMRYYKELESKGEVVFLKPVEAFTKDGLERAFKLYSIKHGDVVILLDASGGGASAAEEIVKRGVRAVIACTTMSHPAEEKLSFYNTPVVSSKDLTVEWIEGYPYVKADDLDKAIRAVTKTEKSSVNRMLQDVVEEYKKERLKEIGRAAQPGRAV